MLLLYLIQFISEAVTHLVKLLCQCADSLYKLVRSNYTYLSQHLKVFGSHSHIHSLHGVGHQGLSHTRLRHLSAMAIVLVFVFVRLLSLSFIISTFLATGELGGR